MNRSVDHALVEALLRNGSLSYREIARQAGCSDWTVRSIAHQLEDNDITLSDAPPSLLVGVTFVGILALIFGIVSFLARRPPMDGAM